MTNTLEQTKGKVKLEGKIVGIGNENSSKEGFTKNDAEFKSLSFFVQTSENNRIKVELFGMVREFVYAYSNKDKKTKKIPWSKRNDNHGTYKLMGTNLTLVKDEKTKKNKKVVMVEIEAIEYMLENLKDGDDVRVMAEFAPQSYTNQQGVEVTSNKFNILSVTKLDNEIDFESEDFKEVSVFEQEIVITDTMVDKETKQLLVSAKIIGYKGNSHVDTAFIVDAEKYPKLAKNMVKRMKFGDFIKVYGLVINKTIQAEAEVEEDADDWGGDEDIKGEISTNYINEYIQEMQATAVDSSTYEPKKYNEEDFINEEEDAFNGDVDSDNDSDDEVDPFADDSDDDEDLPFD